MTVPNRLRIITLPLCAIALAASVMMLMHSLQGYQLIGCGAGSGCDSVMGSLWAYVGGRIPVSGVAVLSYIVLIICLLFLGDGSKEEDKSLDKVIWTMMLVLAGAIVGAALWFSYLQLSVLHTFCKYCTATHVLGCVIAGILFFNAPSSMRRRVSSMVLGLVAAGLFGFAQVKTMPGIVYDDGVAVSSLPTFSADELPSVGPDDAEYDINLMFDFQCIHCRAMHRLLPEVIEKSKGRYRFILCPVSLSNECNPYIPHDGIDRFRGSCTMAKLALAVWFSNPDKYETVQDYLLGSGDDHLIIDPVQAYDHVASIIGRQELDRALEDTRISSVMSRSFELFGRTSSSEKSGIPRMIHGRNWLVPETSSADELIAVTESSLFR